MVTLVLTLALIVALSPSRLRSRRDSCYNERSSDEDDGDEDDELGRWKKRDPSRPRRRRALDSEGEDEESSDGKLWRGAHAEGWRVHAKGGSHYVYVSPAVRSRPQLPDHCCHCS